MKSCYLALAVSVCAIAATGCSIVSSSVPVGSEVFKIEKPDQWDGTWVAQEVDNRKNEILDDTVYDVKVIEPERGLVRVGGTSTDEKTGKLETEYMEVHLRRFGDWIIGSAFEHTEGAFFWCLVQHEKDRITLVIPDAEKFKEEIKAAKLPGKDYTLTRLSDRQLKYILEENFDRLFFKKEGRIVFLRQEKEKAEEVKK